MNLAIDKLLDEFARLWGIDPRPEVESQELQEPDFLSDLIDRSPITRLSLALVFVVLLILSVAWGLKLIPQIA